MVFNDDCDYVLAGYWDVEHAGPSGTNGTSGKYMMRLFVWYAWFDPHFRGATTSCLGSGGLPDLFVGGSCSGKLHEHWIDEPKA